MEWNHHQSRLTSRAANWGDNWSSFFKKERFQPIVASCVLKYDDEELGRVMTLLLSSWPQFFPNDLVIKPCLIHGNLNTNTTAMIASDQEKLSDYASAQSSKSAAFRRKNISMPIPPNDSEHKGSLNAANVCSAPKTGQWHENGVAEEYSRLSMHGAMPWFAHNELDLAMLRVKGCMGPAFFEAYHDVVPRTPVYEYRQRLYMVYVLLEMYLLEDVEVRGTILRLAVGCIRFAKKHSIRENRRGYTHLIKRDSSYAED